MLMSAYIGSSAKAGVIVHLICKALRNVCIKRYINVIYYFIIITWRSIFNNERGLVTLNICCLILKVHYSICFLLKMKEGSIFRRFVKSENKMWFVSPQLKSGNFLKSVPNNPPLPLRFLSCHETYSCV